MGCGPGRFTDVALTMGARVIALDYSSAIDAAQTNFAGKEADVLFIQGDALKLPLKTDSVDYVFTIGVLHHTPSPANGVREAHRVLKRGGSLLCVCMEPEAFTPILPYACGGTNYQAGECYGAIGSLILERMP